VLTASVELWPLILGVLDVPVALLASGHAVLNKRDSRAAIAWAGLIWLLPFLGAGLYVVLGINRVRRRARALRLPRRSSPEAGTGSGSQVFRQYRAATLLPLQHAVERITGRALLAGNRVEPLHDGDQAYPAMLAAIDGATASVALATYIFDHDEVGLRFHDALARAVGRGVAVRVLLDAVGMRYSSPTIDRVLRRARVPVARFMPTRVPWQLPFVNLRNHRKLLVVDGRIAFTGGMNLRAAHVLGSAPRRPVRDLHFRIEGPVVRHLQDVFGEDWAFATGESLIGEQWFPALTAAGTSLMRGIADGPDEDYPRLRQVLACALSAARESVTVVTPYFVPDGPLITALGVAALRGVRVRIVLPSENNLPYMQWASNALLWQVLQPGCEVWMTAPPFDHTKLVLVDSAWTLLGSANWDARSLRLNFELDVEVYDPELARHLEGAVTSKLQGARQVTLKDVDGRRLSVRLRDGVMRLFAPYL
jgi:cardiolipin synthase